MVEFIPPALASFTLSLTQALLLLAIAWAGALYLTFCVRPKRFYIVRHGQTYLNKEGIKQGVDGGLSPLGQEQAEKIGAYLSHFPVRTIYTSPYERAVETATIISKQVKARIKKTALLAERRNPSEVIGKSVSDPQVKEVVAHIERGFHEDEYRYSDEENFKDLLRRSAKCLSYLERSHGTRIAVVTHHAFLQVLLSYMLYRNNLHADDYVKLAFFNPSDNGGLTVCEYHPWRRGSPTRGWEIVAYNLPL